MRPLMAPQRRRILVGSAEPIDFRSIAESYHGRDIFQPMRRDELPGILPADELDEAQYSVLQAEIFTIYRQYAVVPQLDNHTPLQITASVLSLCTVWDGIVSDQLCLDQQFQRLVVDNLQQPGSVNFDTLRFKDSWLIGIYLPGFYHVFDKWSNGVGTIGSRLVSIIAKSKSRLESLVQHVEERPIQGEIA